MSIQSIIAKFNIANEREDFEAIHEVVEKAIYFRGTNLWILIFAILIASVGLNVNSTAVIIGAMLISPLMGPILGMGYSIATYDFRLLRKALANFGFAVIASLATSTLYFLITPLSEAHSELLARTRPNIYDVVIALVGGLAGIVAISSKQKGNVIPGVAIATALMPPLCTAGYGLATFNWNFFFGAFYLFTINSVFIGTATLVTVRLMKYPIWHEADEKEKKTANWGVTALVLFTIVPSIFFGIKLVNQERFKQSATRFVHNESHIDGDYLLKYEVNPVTKVIELVYGGKMIPEEIKTALMEKSRLYDLSDAKIMIRQGFALEDERGGSYSQESAEINRLRLELSQMMDQRDSIKKNEELANQLLNELKPVYPNVTSCALAEQTYYSDSSKKNSYTSLFLNCNNLASLEKNRKKIESWFRARTGADSIKVYFE